MAGAKQKPKAPVPESEAQQPDIDAVVVVKQATENGHQWVIGEILGNIDPAAVPTGLRLAAKGVEELLGVA